MRIVFGKGRDGWVIATSIDYVINRKIYDSLDTSYIAISELNGVNKYNPHKKSLSLKKNIVWNGSISSSSKRDKIKSISSGDEIITTPKFKQYEKNKSVKKFSYDK